MGPFSRIPPSPPGKPPGLSGGRNIKAKLNLPKRLLRHLGVSPTQQLETKVVKTLENLKIGGNLIPIIDKKSGKIFEAFLPLVAYKLYHKIVAAPEAQMKGLTRVDDLLPEFPEMSIYQKICREDIVIFLPQKRPLDPKEIENIVKQAPLLGASGLEQELLPFRNEAVLNALIELCNKDKGFSRIYSPYLVRDSNSRVRLKIVQEIEGLPRKAVKFLVENERSPKILAFLIDAKADILPHELESLFNYLTSTLIRPNLLMGGESFKIVALSAIVRHPAITTNLLTSIMDLDWDDEEMSGSFAADIIGNPKLPLEKALALVARYLNKKVGNSQLAEAFCKRGEIDEILIGDLAKKYKSYPLLGNLCLHPSCPIDVRKSIFEYLFEEYYIGRCLNPTVKINEILQREETSPEIIDHFLLNIIPGYESPEKNLVDSVFQGEVSDLIIRALMHPGASKKARKYYLDWGEKFKSKYPCATTESKSFYRDCEKHAIKISSTAKDSLDNPPKKIEPDYIPPPKDIKEEKPQRSVSKLIKILKTS